MTVAWGTATDIGRVRPVNEDAFLAQPPVFLVADGMGGYAAGDVASAIVVEEFGGHADDSTIAADWIYDSFLRAGTRIRSGAGGGTTVAGIATIEQNGVPYWLVFNLGDSRVYLRDEGRLTQISVDHSVVQELMDAGEIDRAEARQHPQRHVVTRAVGAPQSPNPDFWLIPAKLGDRALLCSDGLTGEVAEEQIMRLVMTIEHPQDLADQLVASALAAGGRDNVTAVVVDLTRVADSVGPGEGDTDSVDGSQFEQTIPRSDGSPAALHGSDV